MKLTYKQIRKLARKWERSYGEDFIQDGPIAYKVLDHYSTLSTIVNQLRTLETSEEFDSYENIFYAALAKLDIDIIAIIRAYYQNPKEDEDKRIEKYIIKLTKDNK